MELGFFGMFGLSPAMKERIERQENEEAARRLAACMPWTPDIKWEKQLNIKAATYKPLNMFPEVLSSGHSHFETFKTNPRQYALSPDKCWLYVNKRLPRESMLRTIHGNRKGTVLFDGPVRIPCLYWRRSPEHTWPGEPFMSMTPSEIITLRSGTKLAKGHTVIAGLGLGHQLIEVSKRKQVKSITLVERSQTLVDWVFPRVKPHLGCEVEVVVGDARDEVPKLVADIALIDIFGSYGHNDFNYPCPGVPKIWCWGKAKVG